MLQWRAMEEEALALAEQQQADTVGMERSGSLIDLAEAAAAGAAAEAAANTTSDGQLPAVVVEGGNASAMETPLRRLACLQQAAAGAGRGEGEEEEGQGLQKQEGNSGSGMPKATLALVRPLEV